MSATQGVKKTATNKNGAKYKKSTTTSQTTTNTGTKYKYTRKITINGKTRYYYD
jgi:hypothetical protein